MLRNALFSEGHFRRPVIYCPFCQYLNTAHISKKHFPNYGIEIELLQNTLTHKNKIWMKSKYNET